jgi:hypothetical protein
MHGYCRTPQNLPSATNPGRHGGCDMKTLELQLITVGLDDGKQGVFIGLPLVSEETAENNGQVENIWFSNVKEVPDSLTMEELMGLIGRQLFDKLATLQ